MQPMRKDFRPIGGARYGCRPSLLTNGSRYFAGKSDSRLPGPLPMNQRASTGSRSEVNQPNAFAGGVTAHATDARGRQTQGARDQAPEKSEAEKYTVLFSQMLQGNILLSASEASQPQPTVSSSLTRKLPTPAPTGHLLTESISQKHPVPVAANRMSQLGPCPSAAATRRPAEALQASSVPMDLLGWTPSSQGLTAMDLPPPPLPPLSSAILRPSVGCLASFAPSSGYINATGVTPLGVPPASQFSPLPTRDGLTPLGSPWSTPSTGLFPAPDFSASATAAACDGPTPDTSRENPERFLTKSLAGLPPTDILSRVNRMLVQNLFEMTTRNAGDNETATHPCCQDSSHATHSRSRGRSEVRRGSRKRSHEERHPGGRRISQRRRSRKSSRKRRRRRSRSSYSSSSSAQSTPPSSSSSAISACSKSPPPPPQYKCGRNYRNRRESETSSEKRKPEFCRICEIKIKGSFLAHRRGKSHIRKESSVQGGCDVCGISCFNTFSEYDVHRSTEGHLERRSKWQSQVDAENRKKLGLPENKVVIIRNPDGKEQEEELSKLERLRKMARDRISVQLEEKKQEQELKVPPTRIQPEQMEQESSSAVSRGERNSTERNAEGAEKAEDKSSGTPVRCVPATSPLRGCRDNESGDVIIDLTGKAEETGEEREKDETEKEMEKEVEKETAEAAEVAPEKRHVADDDDVTRMINHTQVTSTTADKATKDNCLGREWIVPVSGFFCKICLKFFSANSGESDVKAHCTSEKHRDNHQEQMEKCKRHSTSISSSSASSSLSSSSSSSSSPLNAAKCAVVYGENKLVKEIIIWKTQQRNNIPDNNIDNNESR